jgi:hypothetical protein
MAQDGVLRQCAVGCVRICCFSEQAKQILMLFFSLDAFEKLESNGSQHQIQAQTPESEEQRQGDSWRKLCEAN